MRCTPCRPAPAQKRLLSAPAPGSRGRGAGARGALTAAVAAAGVQRVVRGAAAAAAAGDGEAQLPALPVAVHAVVEAVLAGGVEHQQVHHEVQVALHEGAVPAAGLVRPLDAVQVPVRPVDVVAVLSQAEGVREVVGDHDPPLTCVGTHGQGMSHGARRPVRRTGSPCSLATRARAKKLDRFGKRAGSTEARCVAGPCPGPPAETRTQRPPSVGGRGEQPRAGHDPRVGH